MSSVVLDFHTDDVITQYSTAVQKAMKEAVLIIEAEAKRLCPVDTGRLRTSITNIVREIANAVIEGRIGTNISYARFQELGTSKITANPYLRPALKNKFSEVVNIIQEAVA